ncbi:MAG: hypothetical protein PHQ23_01130 [Candidatus Wallbacteria bacterium]|nr:hypothetical protein [Candidatus Wallbacteria bacterium]
MPKCIFIGDLELCSGFLFTGIDADPAGTAPAAVEKCREIVASGEIVPEYCMVLVEKKLWDEFGETDRAYLLSRDEPLFAPADMKI